MPSSGTADTTPGSSTSKPAELKLTEEQLEQRVVRSAAGFLDYLCPFIEDGEEGKIVFKKKVQVGAEEFRLTLWGIKVRFFSPLFPSIRSSLSRSSSLIVPPRIFFFSDSSSKPKHLCSRPSHLRSSIVREGRS